MTNIALIENFHQEFLIQSKKNGYNVFDFSLYFQNYKNIKNYTNYNLYDHDINKIKNNILNDFNEDIFNNIQCVIFRTNLIVDRQIIDFFPDAKLFIRAGSGYDNIDHRYLYSKKIAGQNTPYANAISAAEHTLSLAFSLLKKSKIFDQFIREGLWRNEAPFNEEIFGKTIGVIGYGHVGKRVAQLFRSLGCSVIIYDPYTQKNENIPELTEKNEIFPEKFYLTDNIKIFQSYFPIMDLLTLHIPLTDETFQMINYPFLENLNPDAFLLNASRGEVLDTNAILRLLKEEKLHGFGADVFEHEPVYDSELFAHQYNTILSPHVGSYTYEAKKRLIIETLNCINKFINKNQVNYPFNSKFYFSRYFND